MSDLTTTPLAEGLWRWTAPHPAWRPGSSWDRHVGATYFEPPSGDCLVLLDPLVPPLGSEDHARFYRALDRDVERLERPLAVLVLNEDHGRSADEVFERYVRQAGASVWASRAAAGELACRVTHHFEDGGVPAGIRTFGVPGLNPGETVAWLPGVAALVFADSLLGSGNGRARIAPRSWGRIEGQPDPSASLRAILDAPGVVIERLVTSHGEPVLQDARAALARAIEEAE